MFKTIKAWLTGKRSVITVYLDKVDLVDKEGQSYTMLCGYSGSEFYQCPVELKCIDGDMETWTSYEGYEFIFRTNCKSYIFEDEK